MRSTKIVGLTTAAGKRHDVALLGTCKRFSWLQYLRCKGEIARTTAAARAQDVGVELPEHVSLE
jgi:hypothetical protein